MLVHFITKTDGSEVFVKRWGTLKDGGCSYTLPDGTKGRLKASEFASASCKWV